MFRMSSIINNASVPMPMVNTYKINRANVNTLRNTVTHNDVMNGSMINRIKGLKPGCSSCGKK
jgi:hypothetical protein